MQQLQRDIEEALSHQQELLRAQRNNLRFLEKQAAHYGIDVPLDMMNKMNRIRNEIRVLEEDTIRLEEQLLAEDQPPEPPLDSITDSIACPYRGMLPFEGEDARFFYGRESEIKELQLLLHYQRWLFVIGPSGSGKSSLVFAGLLPRLQQNNRYAKWLVRRMRLDDHPIDALTEAIGGDIERPDDAIQALVKKHPGKERVLLVIDQFEELFTQNGRPEQNEFIRALKSVMGVEQCTLIIIMRADFYPDLMTSSLWHVPASQRLEIAPLRGEALRDAIQLPAQKAGVDLEARLVERLVADAADEPGALPLVQETMVLLWDTMVNQCISLDSYANLGREGRSGLAVAMAMKADATLTNLTTAQRIIARRIFLRLVQFGEGRLDTRRQQSVAALRAVGDEPILFEHTLRHLTSNRLLTLSAEEGGDDRKVDLAHESLITGWPQLYRWVNEQREAEHTRRRLSLKVDEWVRLGCSDAGLLDAAGIAEAEHWLHGPESYVLGFDQALLDLVRVSRVAIEARERERAEQEAARRQIADLNALSRIGRVTSSSLELLPLTKDLYNVLRDVMSVDVIYLTVYQSKRGVVNTILVDYRGLSIEDERLLHHEEHHAPLTNEVIRSRQLLVIPDLATSSFGRNDHVFSVIQYELRSYVGLPLLLFDQEALGVLGVFSLQPSVFGEREQSLLSSVGSQMALGVQNALLYTQAQGNASAFQRKVDELSTLLDAARLLSSSLRPDEALDALLDLVGRQLNVNTVVLWTIGSDGLLTPAAIDGISPEIADTLHVPVGGGMTGRIAATSQPLIVIDVEAFGQSLYPEFNRRNQLSSFMGVPVIYREQTIGVLSVMTVEPREFNGDEVLLLVGLADQSAIALENARLFQQRERRINELVTLNRISEEINATLELQPLLEALHTGIGEVIDSATSAIGLYDVLQQRMTFPIMRVAGERATDSEPLILDTPDTLIARVVLETRPLLLRTPEEIVSLNPLPTKPGLPQIASYLGVPIAVGDEVLGAIIVQSDMPYAFDSDDERFLVTVASQAATAIAKAHLFDEREQRLKEVTALKDIGSALSSTLDVQQMLEQLHRVLGRVVDTSTSLIGLYDAAQETLTHAVVYDQGVWIRPSLEALGEGPNAWAIRNQAPLLIETLELGEQMGFQLNHDNTHSASTARHKESFLVVPIVSSSSVLGVISIQSYRPYAFDANDLRFVTTAANQAGQALQSAQLFQSELNRRRLADTLRDVAKSFTSTLALDEIQTLILDQLANVVLFDTAMILLREEGTLHTSATRGYDEHDSEHPRIFAIDGTPIFERMAEEHQSILIADVLQDPLADEIVSSFGGRGVAPQIRCWIGAPLLVDDELVGVLTVGSVTPRTYSADDAQVAFALASQASQAIQNARLFEQISSIAAELERANSELEQRVAERTADLEAEKERLEAVHAITLELTSTLDMDEILGKALKMACHTVGAARGSIMLKDVQTGELVCRQVMTATGEVKSENLLIRFGEGSSGLAGWVLTHEEAVRIPDVQNDGRWVIAPGQADHVRSVAAVPLMSNEVPLGVLVLNSPHVGFFTEPQLKLLSTIANEVAIAVHNAELYMLINDFATRMGEALEREREEFSKTRAILRSMTEGVIVLDEDRRVVLFNPAAEQVLGISARAVRDRPLEQLIEQSITEYDHYRASAIYDGLYIGLDAAQASKGVYTFSVELQDPPQTVELRLAPVMGNDGRRYGDIVVLRDITREGALGV